MKRQSTAEVARHHSSHVRTLIARTYNRKETTEAAEWELQLAISWTCSEAKPEERKGDRGEPGSKAAISVLWLWKLTPVGDWCKPYLLPRQVLH